MGCYVPLPLPIWRIGGKIIRTVLRCIVYHSRTESYTYSVQQFLQLNYGLDFVYDFCMQASLFILRLFLCIYLAVVSCLSSFHVHMLIICM